MTEVLLPMLPVILGLLAGAFFFSGTETALFSMQKIERQALQHDSLGRRVLSLLERKAAVITTVLVGNETVNISMAAITAGLVHELAPGKPWITVAVLTPVLVLFAEITPKVLAFRFASAWVRWAAVPMTVFYYLVSPIRLVVGAIVGQLARLFGVTPRESHEGIGERELMSLLDRGTEMGAVAERERDIVEAVFDFGELTVGRLMTPRPDIFAVPLDLPWEELLKRCRDAQFSRVPVYQRRIDDILGVLLIKDLLRYRVEATGGQPGRQIRSMLVPAVFVPSSKPANAMLREFLATKQHMAFVVDEHGTLVGLVTLDDLLSQLVGEFLDHGEEPDPEAMQAVGGTWKVKAWADIADFAEEAGLHLPEEEGYTTVGGFVFHQLGRLPRKGDAIEWSGWKFEVGSMEGRRIGEVTVTPPPSATPAPAPEVAP